MPTHVYANNNEVASKAADGKSVAAFPDVCFSPPAPPVGPMPLPYPNTGEVKDTDQGTAKVFIKDKMSGMAGDSHMTKSMGDEPATKNFNKGMITGALQGKCYFGLWSMDVQMEGKGVPRHLDMVTHNHASMMHNLAIVPLVQQNTPSQTSKDVKNPEKPKFDEQFRIIDIFGKPMDKLDYLIEASGGKQYEGVTDTKGYTQRVSTDEDETLTIYFGQAAKSKKENKSVDTSFTGKGTTNPNTNSCVVIFFPSQTCYKIIFKRVHENISRLLRNQLNKIPEPLSLEEMNNPEADISKYSKRLEWTRVTQEERENAPDYGSPERQVFRERVQLTDNNEDTYGHWWVEIYNSEKSYSVKTLEGSYGFWPANGVNLAQTLFGCPGNINQGQDFDPHARKDRIDWLVDECFHPVITRSTEQEMIAGISRFAEDFEKIHKKWAYPAIFGENCQSFQEKLIKHCQTQFGMTQQYKPIDKKKIVLPPDVSNQ